MSLGQLDEGGSKVVIDHGVLRIWDQHKRLLVKVRRCANRLYILHIKTASPRARTMKLGAARAVRPPPL